MPCANPVFSPDVPLNRGGFQYQMIPVNYYNFEVKVQ